MTTATAVKERPILFSGPMVRAILDGRKTQTRRVVKADVPAEAYADDDDHSGDGWWRHICKCPYGIPGDRLWVRETWHTNNTEEVVHFRADYPGCDPFNEDECGEDCSLVGEKWRPSIFMPRSASRITLEITDVRVERLQEISEADAIAEGMERTGGCRYWLSEERNDAKNRNVRTTARECFGDLWKMLNGPDSWDANPWVWVVEFRRLQP